MLQLIQKSKNILIALLVLLLIAPQTVMAVGTRDKIESNTDIIEELKDRFRRGTVLLRKIESSLSGQKNNLSGVGENIKSTENKLKETRENITTIKSHIEHLGDLELESARKMLALRRQVAERENEILIIRETLARKRTEKQKLYDRLEKMQRQGTPVTPSGFGSLSVLLAFDTLGESMQRDYISDVIKKQTFDSFQDIERLERELGLTSKRLRIKTNALNGFKARMDSEIRNLSLHKDAKKRLLLITKDKEKIYEELVEETKREQEEVKAIIANLQENYSFVESKLKDLKENEILSENIALDDFENALNNTELKSKSQLAWPVAPTLGISAYFQDGAYKKTMGVAHNAIDIPVIQGSAVHTAQTGVVHKVKRSDDTSYNYIIIAHREGILTLYGHMSRIDVNEGDTVFTGDSIGLSGGIPGTRGAGWLTTGAHLHLEVFKDWKHVDPLEYLPLEYLPIEYVPKKYIKRLTEEDSGKGKVSRKKKEKVKRVAPTLEGEVIKESVNESPSTEDLPGV